MKQFIGCDVHKKFSMFVVLNEQGEASRPTRVEHDREAMRAFLRQWPRNTPIAIETSGHYYWLVDEIEAAGLEPHLGHATETKKRMGKTHKSDKLDAKGLAILLRNGTLPEVWIPPAELRDQREMLRLRMFLVSRRTQVKNRIHGALARHNLQLAAKDLFSKAGRQELEQRLEELPPHTRRSVEIEWTACDFLEDQIADVERHLEAILEPGWEAQLLRTMPCVGRSLSAVIALEIGDVSRFPRAENLAGYAGLVPRLIASGGKIHHGHTAPDVNRTLKWAFVEAANMTPAQSQRLADRHVLRLYSRVRRRQNHFKAVVAVGRHLAEAAYWILTKREAYRDPLSPPRR
jgi:transposase